MVAPPEQLEEKESEEEKVDQSIDVLRTFSLNLSFEWQLRGTDFEQTLLGSICST